LGSTLDDKNQKYQIQLDNSHNINISKDEIDDIWKKCSCPYGYNVKINAGYNSIERYFDISLNGHSEEKVNMFNEILDKIGTPKRWLKISNGYVLTLPKVIELMRKNHLIPHDSNYYDLWE
jgi:hypothetical protein